MTDETTTEQLAEIEGQAESTPATEYTPPEGWRVVRFGEQLLPGDEIVQIDDGRRYPTHRIGDAVGPNQQYIRRIKPQPQPEPQPTTDDPSGPGWRDVEPDELLRPGDMYVILHPTANAGAQARQCGTVYRRRIEPQQPNDSEPETIDSWEMRLAKMTQWNLELEALVAEAERSGEQVNAELQQLREQVQTLTRERDRYRNQLAGAIEHSKAPDDPGGPGWRDVEPDEILQAGDMCPIGDRWEPTAGAGALARRCGTGYRRRIEPQPELPADTAEELRSEVSYVQNLLGESRQRVTQLEELVASLRTINAAQEKAVVDAGKANDKHVDTIGQMQRELQQQHRELQKRALRIFDLDTINAAQEKSVVDAGKENTALRRQLAVAKEELKIAAAVSQQLQIELDAAQQVPVDSPDLQQLQLRLADMTLDRDQYKDAWNQIFTDLTTIKETTKAETVEAITEWLQPFRGCNSPALALLLLEALPHIIRSLTGLNPEEIE
ncbi:MAG: hypothetical protein ACK52I_36350 [Pseudomonadota bacterium]